MIILYVQLIYGCRKETKMCFDYLMNEDINRMIALSDISSNNVGRI